MQELYMRGENLLGDKTKLRLIMKVILYNQIFRERCIKERVADIMYFARGGRRVTMYSRESGEIELYCSLVEIYRVLITEGFIILISQCLLIYLI